LRWSKKTSRHHWTKPRAPRRNAFRPQLELLEDRVVPSHILWTNRGSGTDKAHDFDKFSTVFGTRADLARNVIATAIQSWQTTINSFNYSDPG
jgi:hypothetical protein